MARRRRASDIEFNFDGLTDSVTNLVGALILLVVLLIGVSREAVSQTQPRPQPEPPKPGGDKSIRPILERVNLLKGELAAMDGQIRTFEVRIAEQQQRIDELLAKLQAVEPPKPKPQDPPKEKEPKQVEFRAPLESLTQKEGIAFVCQGSRISYVDFKSINETLKRNPQFLKQGGTVSVPGGDFDLQIGGGPFDPQLELIRKAGRLGETLEQALRAGSVFTNIIQGANANQHHVEFAVYPDSFEIFRAARKLTWDLKLEVGWGPMKSGEAIRLGQGGVGVVN